MKKKKKEKKKKRKKKEKRKKKKHWSSFMNHDRVLPSVTYRIQNTLLIPLLEITVSTC